MESGVGKRQRKSKGEMALYKQVDFLHFPPVPSTAHARALSLYTALRACVCVLCVLCSLVACRVGAHQA
jgi:hypothetical protein